MAYKQRQPVLFDKSRDNEPYIPLPAPHENIRITPCRMTDAEPMFECLNHPAIYPNLVGPPYPYERTDGELWLAKQQERSAPDWRYFTGDESAPIQDGKIFDYTPLWVIREVQSDGSQTFVGVADIVRSSFMDEADEQRKEELTKENDAKPLGDPSIVYMIGDYLAPSYHGKGIMTAVIRELIHSWGAPYMGLREVKVVVIDGNIGSRRVFEKLGFKYVGFAEGTVPTQGKREKVLGEWIFHYVVEQ